MAKRPKIQNPGDPNVNSQPEAAASATIAGGESSSPASAEAASTDAIQAAPTQIVSEAATTANGQANATPQTGAASQTIVADKAKNDALQQQVAATANLVGSPAALDWSHLTQPARLMAVVGANAPDKDPNAHLPHPEQVNWATQQGDRVLTKQGWLLRP